MKGKKILTALCLLILFFGCSTPPPEASTMTLLQSLHDFIYSDEDPGGISDLFYSFRNLAGAEDLISSLSQGEELILSGRESTPLENTLVYMSGVNEITVHRDFYITGNRKRALFYSLDGQTWFDMQNRKREGVVNIDYFYPMDSDYDRESGQLRIFIQWVAGASPQARPVKMKNKPTIDLSDDTSFYSQREELNNLDITGVFLKIPAGTRLNFYIRFSGNLLKSRIFKGEHRVEILEDFYIYTSNTSDLRLGISRDGETWNFNPFGFDYNLSEIFLTPEQNRMEYHREMEIFYK